MSGRSSIESLRRLARVSDPEAAAVFGPAGCEELLAGITELPFGPERTARSPAVASSRRPDGPLRLAPPRRTLGQPPHGLRQWVQSLSEMREGG